MSSAAPKPTLTLEEIETALKLLSRLRDPGASFRARSNGEMGAQGSNGQRTATAAPGALGPGPLEIHPRLDAMKVCSLTAMLVCLGCGDAARPTTTHPQKYVVNPPDAAAIANPDAGAKANPDAGAKAKEEAARLAKAEAEGRAADAIATPLCDGQDRMELAYGTFGGGQTSGEEYLARRNGIVGMFVDGGCRYYTVWVAHSHGFSAPLLTEVHTGELDSATRDMLAAALRYSEWGLLAARVNHAYSLPTASAMFDDGSGMLTDGSRTVDCRGACTDINGVSLLPEGTSLLETAHQWAQDLYAKGTPMSGAVRVMATRPARGLDAGHAAQWPLSRPIEDFAFMFMPGSTELYLDHVVEGADAQTLRDLRTQQIGGAFTPWWDGVGAELPVTETPDGPLYSLVVSDVLPYEDDWSPRVVERLHIWNQVYPPRP